MPIQHDREVRDPALGRARRSGFERLGERLREGLRRLARARLVPRLRLRARVDPRRCAPGTLVLLPTGGVRLACGIAALVEIAAGEAHTRTTLERARELASVVRAAGLDAVRDANGVTSARREDYAGGAASLDALTGWARALKRSDVFADVAADPALRDDLRALAADLLAFADAETARLESEGETLSEADLELFSGRVLRVRDVAWHVEQEALALAAEVASLGADGSPALRLALRRVAAVLRSIDRIEIRGRDSAGLAVQVAFPDRDAYAAFRSALTADESAALASRAGAPDLPPCAVVASEAGERPVLTFVYKVAAEVGRLGDNGAALRAQIADDALLRRALGCDGVRMVCLGHTRWASSGVINLANCHPIDNSAYAGEDTSGGGQHALGQVFVVMNGDVDNHLELRARYEQETRACVSPRVTTDTKVVALEIERHLRAGATIDEAFERACGAFDGSCAIGMVSDLAPGRLFLSLRGSGQSLYVGVSDEGFFASSEVYGLVEETGRYLKMDGETERVPGKSASRGEVVIVDAAGPLGPEGLRRRGYDGADLPVAADDIRLAEITTRDVDRGDFEHFFRKEITQSARSVARTLWGRVSHGEDGLRTLSSKVLGPSVRSLLENGVLRRVYVSGQGTAAVAGAGIAEYLRRVTRATSLRVEALPATEVSGFALQDDMSDTLIIAVTQSGSTADTNRAVDLARRRGALVAAIVNRRNSDITYRADSVVYTSDGRDVEMSVASTKAFYAQIVAGAILSLAIAEALGCQRAEEIDAELQELELLPERMRRVIDDESAVREAAERFAPTREHWAVVGSGPNHVAGREVRIKLSELCYKSIAIDTVEDKKHIDLSSEPLVLVLAAGNPESVLNDVIKDVQIFAAHTGIPIVFAPEGERRFDPYAAAVVPIPQAPPLTSMILCALAGHLFGYHAARAIDENARFLAGVRAKLVEALGDDVERQNLPETLAPARREFLERLQGNRFTSALHPVTAVQMALLFEQATGSAVGNAETAALFGGDSPDLVASFVNVLGDALEQTARPIDAIKHQAKIVTVGTSRPEEEMTGVLAEALAAAGISQESLVPVDQLALRRIQPAVAEVEGATRYAVSALRPDGLPGAESQIRVLERTGVASTLRSRVEAGGPLAGTKRHVVSERRLFLGVGHGDRRRIAIVPVLGSDRHVSGLVLFHLRFAESLARDEKLKVLGARRASLRDLIEEADHRFTPELLDHLTPEQVALEPADDLADVLLGVLEG